MWKKTSKANRLIFYSKPKNKMKSRIFLIIIITPTNLKETIKNRVLVATIKNYVPGGKRSNFLHIEVVSRFNQSR